MLLAPGLRLRVLDRANTLSIKIAQKPYIIGSLGPKALKYESFDAKGYAVYPKQSDTGLKTLSAGISNTLLLKN